MMLEKEWEEFTKESEYISLDRTLKLKTICIDFGEFILNKLKKRGVL